MGKPAGRDCKPGRSGCQDRCLHFKLMSAVKIDQRSQGHLQYILITGSCCNAMSCLRRKLPAGTVSRGTAERIVEVLNQALGHHPGSDALLMPLMAAERVLLLELDDNSERLESLWDMVGSLSTCVGHLHVV